MKIQSFGLLSLLSVVSWTSGSAFVPRSMTAVPPSRPIVGTSTFALSAAAADVDLPTVRSAIADLVKEKNCGPILVRLAWHDAGTYNKEDGSGGPRGAMQFEGDASEANFGANNGLDIARSLIQKIKDGPAKDMSYADFWTFASIVAIEEM